ncbi:MAG TPA: relaxase/mobilization nuclease domain-containing protein [Lactovum miscens]|uniref:relaxase/mobilization nuclease domain-containing protein n=1 Tax=Lactovum miscens TaxID=190387 RepID=UPI002EDAEA44
MVYTKQFQIHNVNKLIQAKNYVENADKVTVSKKKKGEEKSHFENLFPYVTNDDKTMSKQLVSGYHIEDVYDAATEFLATKRLAAISKGTDLDFNPKTKKLEFKMSSLERNNAVLARHLIQSFSPEDHLTPEEIHELGRKTVLEFTGGEYEFIIATHTDKHHIHNHIIINTTNLVTGKSMPWKITKSKSGKSKDQSKELFEKISDKIASEAGAKIIEKSPKNSHLRYTQWQADQIFKNKIKQRLDFLITHSSNFEDFTLKASALNLEVDFSGKWSTFKLLDEPQLRNTRGRVLNKKDPEAYNLENILKQLEENVGQFSVEDIVKQYEETEDFVRNDFDYQITLEPWQINQVNEKGYYINLDFGVENRGQVFVGSYKVDKLENGNYTLYLKKNEYFYFISKNEKNQGRYLTGETLIKQLNKYYGTIPIKKEPIISTINQLVDAINFLAEHDVTTGNQMVNLEQQLNAALEEARDKLSELDDKIIELNEAAKHFVTEDYQEDDGEDLIFEKAEEEKEKNETKSQYATMSFVELQQELASARASRQLLRDKFNSTVDDLNKFYEIKSASETKQKNVAKGL